MNALAVNYAIDSSDFQVERRVRCDLGRLQRVVSILLGNALNHGSSDAPVQITLRADSQELVLKVWNDGAPIPPEHLDKIFHPFWRSASSAHRDGLGLGLHICSQIIQAHAGTLSVTSTAEEGTRFTARLPLERARPVPSSGLDPARARYTADPPAYHTAHDGLFT